MASLRSSEARYSAMNRPAGLCFGVYRSRATQRARLDRGPEPCALDFDAGLRRIYLETISLQQLLADRLAARVQFPCAARQRILQRGADAAVELAVRHDGHRDVGDLVEPRRWRQHSGDIGQRLVEKEIGRGLVKRFCDVGIVGIGPRAAEPVSGLRPQRNQHGGGGHHGICAHRGCVRQACAGPASQRAGDQQDDQRRTQ